MTELSIRDTIAALDQALARIAISIGGNHHDADALVEALGRGEATAGTLAFLAEGAALMRARLLLTQDACLSRAA